MRPYVEPVRQYTSRISNKMNTENRATLINRVENLVLLIIEQMTSGRFPKIDNLYSHIKMEGKCTELVEYEVTDNDDYLNYELPATWSEKVFSGEIEDSIHEKTQESKSIVDFSHKRGKFKLALMMTISAKAHKLLIVDEYQTKRSLYYELKGGLLGKFIDQQSTVDCIINHAAKLLECTTWNLGFLTTAKGLISGELTLSLKTGEDLQCNKPGGVLIPQIPATITSIKSSASCVIVVEKDAIFQRLLEEDCTNKLNSILVTGKGYPDAATRIFVKMLIEELKIPGYILVDADPFGIDIMCVYKYGSSTLWWERESLVCPTLQWIGIYPSELEKLNLQKIPLTEFDGNKLESIKKRPYVDDNLREELRVLNYGKAEMESVAEISALFLTSLYLPMKI